MSLAVAIDSRSADAHEIAADLVRRARAAQQILARADQARTDEAVRAIAWSLYKPEQAKTLAELAVEDTGPEMYLIKSSRSSGKRLERCAISSAPSRSVKLSGTTSAALSNSRSPWG